MITKAILLFTILLGFNTCMAYLLVKLLSWIVDDIENEFIYLTIVLTGFATIIVLLVLFGMYCIDVFL